MPVWNSKKDSINNTEVLMQLTVFISGLAVTICFSAGKVLFSLNSTSPGTTKKPFAQEAIEIKKKGNLYYFPILK